MLCIFHCVQGRFEIGGQVVYVAVVIGSLNASTDEHKRTVEDILDIVNPTKVVVPAGRKGVEVIALEWADSHNRKKQVFHIDWDLWKRDPVGAIKKRDRTMLSTHRQGLLLHFPGTKSAASWGAFEMGVNFNMKTKIFRFSDCE